MKPLFVALLLSFAAPAFADDCRDHLVTLKPYIGKPAKLAIEKSGVLFFPETPSPYGQHLFYRGHHDDKTLGINLVIDKKTRLVLWAECVTWQ
jgi:hypothetical protein